LKQHDYLRAAHYLRRFVNGCPEMDWGWETLFETYERAGSRALVLETYPDYAGYLRRESKTCGVELKPSPRIRQIVEAAVRQEQSRTLQTVQNPSAPSGPLTGTVSDSVESV